MPVCEQQNMGSGSGHGHAARRSGLRLVQMSRSYQAYLMNDMKWSSDERRSPNDP